MTLPIAIKPGAVVRNIPRTELDRIAPLATYGVATVHEAVGRRGLLAPYIRPIFPGASIVGNAVTVSVAPGDNMMIHVVVELLREGDILVVAPTSPCTDGYFGDLFATALKARGVRGLIIDAGVRDVKTLTEMNFPVWSKAVHAQGTVKEAIGCVNVPVVAAGAYINPGDIIIADDDGVMVLPRADVDAAVKGAKARAEKEEKNRQSFEAGAIGMDLYGFREKFAAKGLYYVDELSDLLGK